MPSLGADMDAGTIVEWRVKPGDEVHRGDIVAVVDTDKADIDVEIFESGVVDELLVPVGGAGARRHAARRRARRRARAHRGAEHPGHGRHGAHLAEGRVPGAAPGRADPARRRPAPTPPALKISRSVVPAAPAGASGQVHSPVLRRLAQHLGVDLAAR